MLNLRQVRKPTPQETNRGADFLHLRTGRLGNLPHKDRGELHINPTIFSHGEFLCLIGWVLKFQHRKFLFYKVFLSSTVEISTPSKISVDQTILAKASCQIISNHFHCRNFNNSKISKSQTPLFSILLTSPMSHLRITVGILIALWENHKVRDALLTLCSEETSILKE